MNSTTHFGLKLLTFKAECAILNNEGGNSMSRIKTLVPETVNEFDEIDFTSQA